MAVPDIESLLVAWLAPRVAPVEVATDLDGLFDGDTTPLVVQLNALPGAADAPAWNGPTLRYQLDVDVDFYGPDRVAALDLGRRVTDLAETLRGVQGEYGRVAEVIAPPPTTRPDYNQRVRHYGSVWSITTRPA